MAKVYLTRKIPDIGIQIIKDKGYDVTMNEEDRVLSKEELISALKANQYDAVLCLLTDKIDSEVFDASPSTKIFANYAVGYNNIDTEEAKKRGLTITNTPGKLSGSVAEHTIAMVLALSCRLIEADKFTREGKYQGWAPELFLGLDLNGMTYGILGAGRIGYEVAKIAKNGLGMNIIYYDVKQNEHVENDLGGVFKSTPEDVLKEADVVSVHVPLLDSTKHLLNKERLGMMKKSAYLVNTSRGPVIDEKALVEVLKDGGIKGAGLDVFEEEPKLAPGLAELPNVVITPHIASATEKTRNEMAELAGQAIVEFLDGKEPKSKVV